MKMILIEGNIGAGKSTLTEKLAKELDVRVFYETVDDESKLAEYLKLYYQDRKRYALEFQFYMLSQRLKDHKAAIDHIWQTGQSCLFDRSVYSTHSFTKQNWLDGNISDLGYDNYLKLKEQMIDSMLAPHIVLYLKTTPERCLESIRARNRECEKDVSLQYLTKLHDRHEELMQEFMSRGSKVIDVEWDNFGKAIDVIKKLEAHV